MLRGCDRRRDVAVADEVDAGACLAQLCDQLVVAVALEDDDREVVDVHSLRLRDALEVLGRRRVDVDRVRASRADGDLVHVQRRAGEEHRPALGDGDDGDRVRHPEGGQARPLEGIDGDVHLGPASVADLLAVVEHRRLVLLALPDDDDAAHGDGVDHQPHRVDRGLVGRVLVAPPDPAGRERRGRLGNAYELEREVPVRDRAVDVPHGRMLTRHPRTTPSVNLTLSRSPRGCTARPCVSVGARKEIVHRHRRRPCVEGQIDEGISPHVAGRTSLGLDQEAHALVVRSRQVEGIRDRSQPPVRLGDRLTGIIERCERPDQTAIDAGS